MTGKHWMMGGGALLSVTAVVVLIVPASRRHVFGTIRGEPSLNNKYLSQWVEELNDEDNDTRRAATVNLSNFGAPGRPALPALARVMREDQEARVRGSAAFAIYKISSDITRHQGVHATEVLDALIPSLDDPDPLVRMNVALSLGTLEEEANKAVPGLQAAIKRNDNKAKVLTFPLTIREQMITTLGFIGPGAKDTLGMLEELLLDKEETTRNAAARTLGRIGPDAKHAVQLLLDAIDDEAETETVQESAREALKLIDPNAAAKLANK